MVWVGEDERKFIYNVGTALLFMEVQYKVEQEYTPDILTCLHLYVAQRGRKRRPRDRRPGEGDVVFDMYDPLSLTSVPSVPLPVMRKAFRGNGQTKRPFLWLYDTEAISSAVWCQQDYDVPDLFWFIRRRAENE